MKLTSCSSCGASIFFVRHARTRNMVPVDAKPEKRLVLVTRADGPGAEDETLAKVEDTFVSHFVTCVNAKSHRKERTS